MTQQALFVLESRDGDPCLDSETAGTVDRMRADKAHRRLANLVERLQAADDPIERARVAYEIRDLAEGLIASNIRDANGSGQTWREIGARLGIPFQSLYRRYGREDR